MGDTATRGRATTRRQGETGKSDDARRGDRATRGRSLRVPESARPGVSASRVPTSSSLTGPESPPPTWTLPHGWRLHYLPITGSTNDDARDLALAGSPERTVVLADEQRAGRGRLGRLWLAPRGSSLLFSIVLRRALEAIHCTAACSVAVTEAVEQITSLKPRIKWPNDVMVRDLKVCGVLTEVLTHGGRKAAIVGIGLNVNLDPEDAGLPATATSLAHECGTVLSRAAVLRAILERLDAYLALDDAALGATVQTRWESLLWRRWQEVQIDQSGASLSGVVEGLAPLGALRIRTAGGVVEVAVGDVS